MNQNESDEFEYEDEGFQSNTDYVGLVRRRYPLLMLGCALGALGAAIYYSKQTPMYRSSLAVHVGQRYDELSSAEKGSTNTFVMQNQVLETHLELFSSPKILSQANELLAKTEGSAGLRVNPLLLSVSRSVKGASTLKATYSDTKPENAVKILLAIYETYKDYIDSKSKNFSAEAADLIAKALVENEEAVRTADVEYRTHIAELPALVDIEGNVQDVHRMRLSAIESELASLRSNLASSVSRNQSIQEFLVAKGESEISEIEMLSLFDDKDFSRFRTVFGSDIKNSASSGDRINEQMEQEKFRRLTELNMKLKGLKARFGAGHPSVDSVKDEIAFVEEYFTEAKRTLDGSEVRIDSAVPPRLSLENYSAILQRDIAEFKKREAELLALAETESQLAKEVVEKTFTTAALKSKLDRAQDRYDEVFKRLQQIDLAKDYAGFTTDLISPPVPAGAPYAPILYQILGSGLGLGGFVGFALAFLAELLDKTFKSPRDVERSMQAPILAHIPRLDTKKIAKSMAKDSQASPVLAAFHQPRGSDSETFRMLRTSLLFAAKKSEHCVFMVTSPSPGDGKSTVISNLAVSLAQIGKRVLLIDADMRRPTISKLFGIINKPGLSDILAEGLDLSEVVQESEQSNLYILPNGNRTSRPAELLESDRFSSLLQKARHAYDFVLIDTPPVLAVADPIIVSDQVNGCILAVRVTKGKRHLVENARNTLAEHDANILGVVVNVKDYQKPGYGYNYYGYSSYNYYGKKEYGYLASYRSYYSSASDETSSAPSKSSRKSKARVGSEP